MRNRDRAGPVAKCWQQACNLVDVRISPKPVTGGSDLQKPSSVKTAGELFSDTLRNASGDAVRGTPAADRDPRKLSNGGCVDPPAAEDEQPVRDAINPDQDESGASENSQREIVSSSKQAIDRQRPTEVDENSKKTHFGSTAGARSDAKQIVVTSRGTRGSAARSSSELEPQLNKASGIADSHGEQERSAPQDDQGSETVSAIPCQNANAQPLSCGQAHNDIASSFVSARSQGCEPQHLAGVLQPGTMVPTTLGADEMVACQDLSPQLNTSSTPESAGDAGQENVCGATSNQRIAESSGSNPPDLASIAGLEIGAVKKAPAYGASLFPAEAENSTGSSRATKGNSTDDARNSLPEVRSDSQGPQLQPNTPANVAADRQAINGIAPPLQLTMHGDHGSMDARAASSGPQDPSRGDGPEPSVAERWNGTESTGISTINQAKLIQTMNAAEMRVGMHSSEFGDISIRTSVSQQQMQAEISVDHNELGTALWAHVPSIQAKLGSEYGLQASIHVQQGGASLSDQRGGSSQGQNRPWTMPDGPLNGPTAMQADLLPLQIQSNAMDEYRLDIRA